MVRGYGVVIDERRSVWWGECHNLTRHEGGSRCDSGADPQPWVGGPGHRPDAPTSRTAP